jgi:hypothetical protein
MNVNHLFAMSQELVRNTYSKVKEILVWVRQRLNLLQHQVSNLANRQEQIVEDNQPFMYTEEQLMARLKFFIGICLALTLTGIVFVVLYSIIFITQPLNAISPIDQKFFEMIIPIATFLTGTLSGIMLAGNDKDLKSQALNAALKPPPVSPAPVTPTYVPQPMPVSAPVVTRPTAVSASAPAVAPAAAPAADPTADPIVGYGGKLAPPPAPQPEI